MHTGRAETGHQYVFVRDREALGLGAWYQCNDTHVRRESEAAVLHVASGIALTNAFVVIYERESGGAEASDAQSVHKSPPVDTTANVTQSPSSNASAACSSAADVGAGAGAGASAGAGAGAGASGSSEAAAEMQEEHATTLEPAQPW